MTLQLSKRQQERNEKVLRDLSTLPGNNKCADCGVPNPSWASYNLGIFLCVRCAAVHRKLGTHISKVRSPTLDKWTADMINTMKTIGNTLSNQRYNPAKKTPSNTGIDSYEDADLERFIRDKYERKTLMKARKLPALPTNAEGRTEGVRSPSLGSNSSANLRVGAGNRVSGESFERAKSPASTNSSFETLPPPPGKSGRAGMQRGKGNPFDAVDWTGLEGARAVSNPLPSSGVSREPLYPPTPEGVYPTNGSASPTMNPFGIQGSFAPQQTPAPAPVQPGAQGRFNPFDQSTSANPSYMNQPRGNSFPAPQPTLQHWNSVPTTSTAVNGQLMSPPLPSPNHVSPGIQRFSTMPPSPAVPSQTSPNPFMQTQRPSISPTKPFFPAIPQTQSPTTLTSPFQPQFPQSTQQYQPQYFNPQTSFQQQPQQQQQPPQQQQPAPNPPFQTFVPNQPSPNMMYGRPRLDNQSILNLYNTPPSNPTQQFIQQQNQPGVSAWNHQ